MDGNRFQEQDRVRCRKMGLTGTIIDIYTTLDGAVICTVESDDPTPRSDPYSWNLNGIVLVDCKESDLEPLNEKKSQMTASDLCPNRISLTGNPADLHPDEINSTENATASEEYETITTDWPETIRYENKTPQEGQ